MQNPTITVIYQNENYMVDYNKLLNSSAKFRQLMQPYIDNAVDPRRLQVRIIYDKFNPRNVRNFLKMLQNIKNDVHANEIPEITELAKLFETESIYNKGMTFIHSRIDPNYSVPNNFYETETEKFITIELAKNLLSQHAKSLNELQFNDKFDLTEPKMDMRQSKIESKSTSSLNEIHSICYKIQTLNPFMKCSRYIFSHEGRILFTAKQKVNEIFIGQGNDVHIHENKFDNRAQILQNADGYNIVNTDDQQFKINYIPIGSKKQYSLQTSFNHKGKMLDWSPKDPATITTYAGEFNHEPIPSKKNIILKNPAGKPTFIVRKMAKNVFELECADTLNPLIVFAVGLSQVIGPPVFALAK